MIDGRFIKVEKYLIEQIYNTVSDLKMQLDSLEMMINKTKMENSDRQRTITEFINLEYTIGKYHAYLSMLNDHELFESFARLHDANKPIINRCFSMMENLYKL